MLAFFGLEKRPTVPVGCIILVRGRYGGDITGGRFFSPKLLSQFVPKEAVPQATRPCLPSPLACRLRFCFIDI